MAWPNTRYADFIDNAPPPVTAAFLNAVQDEIIARRRDEAALARENWQYASGDGPWSIGFFPDRRWRANAVGAASAASGQNAINTAMPWAYLLLVADQTGASQFLALWSVAKLLFPRAGRVVVAETTVNRQSVGAIANESFYFSLSNDDVLTAPPAAPHAVFGWGAGFWRGYVRDAGGLTETFALAGFPVVGTSYRLRIAVSGIAARFYIDGALQATLSVHPPIGSALQVGATLVNEVIQASTPAVRLGPILYGEFEE